MQITPISINKDYSTPKQRTKNGFKGSAKQRDPEYTIGQKATVLATTALGVATSCAILAKCAKYSLNPKNMFKNIKKSYLGTVKYEIKEVIGIGAGSCLGGLAGGYLIDKNKENRKAKNREALMHFGNISIPIVTVGVLVDKVFENAKPLQKTVAGLIGVTAGIFLANVIMNKICNILFQDKSNERGVEITDLPAHLDDAVVSAGYIFPKSKLVHGLGRIIPLALMVAGNEVGTKTKET